MFLPFGDHGSGSCGDSGGGDGDNSGSDGGGGNGDSSISCI